MNSEYITYSKQLTRIKSGIIFLLLSIIIVMLIGIITKDIIPLVTIIFALAPIFLIITFIYEKIKRGKIDNKRRKLVKILYDVADELEANPDNLSSFDVRTHNDIRFIWDDVVDPFLIATLRLFIFAKNGIVSEETGRHRSWTNTSESLITNLAKQTKKIADAVNQDDAIQCFEAIGDLFALALLKRKQILHMDGKAYPQNDFISDARNISSRLQNREFILASSKLKDLIFNVMCQDPSSGNIRWQALIVNWLALRLILIEAPCSPGPSIFWFGPSKVLSMQLDAVISAYMEMNITTMTEVIYESFDWRTRVPKFLARK